MATWPITGCQRAPRPVAVAPQPHRDLADANRKPHANAPQRDRLPTFNRCEPHRIRTEVGCPACNVADAPRPGRGSAARCRMRTATHPQPNRDRRAACRRSWSTANRTETGCRSTAAAPRPGRCEPQAARERSPARPVAEVVHRGRLRAANRIDWPISPKCTRGWLDVTQLPSGKNFPPIR